MAVDWLIPADGELMKELEGCEFEVTTASVVVVSAVFLVHSFLSHITPHARKIDGDKRRGRYARRFLVPT